MRLNSKKLGKSTSLAEVTSVTHSGFWVLVSDAEYFVPFDDYPEFRKVTTEAIFKLKRTSPRQLRWPQLDIDIELDALKSPEHYPLKWK